jgi:hypothetical protein
MRKGCPGFRSPSGASARAILQRVEGISSGGVGQAREKQRRKRRAEAGLHQVMERGKRERPGNDAQQSVFRQRPGELQWQLPSGLHPVREKHTDFRRQPAQREGQRLRRGRIKPLDVVDGEQHRALLGTLCEYADESGCRRPRGSVAGVVPDESAGERVLLDSRKGRSPAHRMRCWSGRSRRRSLSTSGMRGTTRPGAARASGRKRDVR